MTTDDKNKDGAPETRRATWAALSAERRCTKRYGRATVTITRWGNLREIGSDTDLTQNLAAYRDNKVSAEQVVEAFTRARIEGHSPTFRFEEADPARLAQLVVECSKEPVFAASDAKTVADTLVTFEDEQHKKMVALVGQLSASLKGAARLAEVSIPMKHALKGQQQSLDAIGRVLGPKLIIDQRLKSTLLAAAEAQKIAGLGDLQKLRTQIVMPVLPPSLLATYTAPKLPPSLLADFAALKLSASLLAGYKAPKLPRIFEKSFRIKPPLTSELTRQMGLFSASPAYEAALANLKPLALGQPTSLRAVVTAAQSVAAVMEQEGEREVARELRVVTGEMVAVTADPRLDRIEASLTHLTSLVEELTEGQKQGRNEGLAITLFLFLLGLYVQILLWRFPHK